MVSWPGETGIVSELRLRSRVGEYALVGAAATVRKVAEESAPFFVATDRAGPTPLWTIVATPAPAEDPSPVAEPSHHAEWDVASRQLRLACPSAGWYPLITLRYLRTLDRAGAVAGGAVPVHGAAVTAGGRGVLVVGDKWAGKTTAALSIARSRGGRLVSNDDAMLVSTAGPGLRAVGYPRAVGIRVGTLDEHRPALTAEAVRAAGRSHPGNRTREDKVFVPTARLPALGVTIATETPVSVLVELCCEHDGASGGKLVPLAGRAARAVLARHLEPTADRRRLELLRAIGAASAGPEPAVLDRLTGVLSCYRFSHPPYGWVDDLLSAVAVHGDGGPAGDREVS